MKLYFETDNGKLYHGDAVEVLHAIEPVDKILTDPPYNVRDDLAWDNTDEKEFLRFSMEWLAIGKRKSTELISFCSAYTKFKDLCEMIYPRVRFMIWDKPIGSQYAGSSEQGLWFAFEMVLHCYQKESHTFVEGKSLEFAHTLKSAREAKNLSRSAVDIVVRGKKTGLCYRWEEGACLPTDEQVEKLESILDLPDDFFLKLQEMRLERDDTLKRVRQFASENAAVTRDVFSYRTETNTIHPCQKPLGLIVSLVQNLTEPGTTILDPFIGSGTLAEACEITGRKWVGIEQDEGNCQKTVKRVRKALQQPSLWAYNKALQSTKPAVGGYSQMVLPQ